MPTKIIADRFARNKVSAPNALPKSPSANCIQITARLDKIGQVSPIIPKAYKNNSYSSGYS